MKTRHSSESCGAHAFRLLSAIAIVLLWSVPLPGGGVSATPGGVSAKLYKLFLGANLTVEWQGKLWPVRGVQRNAFVIDADGKPVRVGGTDLRMKIGTTLKMTTAYASVTDLKAERAYTPANDPRHWARDVMMAASQSTDDLDFNSYNLNKLQSAAARDAAGGQSSMVTPEMLRAATTAFQNSLADQNAERYSVGAAMSREQVELSQKLFDAFSLSFKIAAAKPLGNPYLVVFVRFRDKANNPKTTRLLVYGQLLPSIDQRPQTVRMFRGGFPPGYQLVDYQIHLYEHGTEIATGASPKEMAMTADEAFEYSIVDYTLRNRDKTLPPAPAWAFWPKKALAGLPAKERDRSLFIKVSKDGSASGFYSDKAYTRPIKDGDLEAIRSDLRFNPALAKGKPVEGVVAMNLGREPD